MSLLEDQVRTHHDQILALPLSAIIAARGGTGTELDDTESKGVSCGCVAEPLSVLMANLSETAQFTKDAVERALTRWLFLCQAVLSVQRYVARWYLIGSARSAI
jgi:hypothetical protein